MDTTAAAELGMGMLGPGVDSLSYSDSHAGEEVEVVEVEDEAYSPKEVDPSENIGHHARPPLAPETSQKKMRMMPAGGAYIPGYYPGGTGELPGSNVVAPAPAPGSSAEEMWYANPWQGVAAAVSSGMNMNLSNFMDSSAGSYAPPGFGGPVAPGSESGRGRGTGSIFYKTKLCSKFKLGACPFDARCNFAHGVEELRKPPQGWESLAAAAASQDPSVMQAGRGTSRGPIDSQRFKTRTCKYFREASTCPYGDRCTFLHDQNSIGAVENTCVATSWSSGDCLVPNRPPNYKTKICNQWEASGHCTFGDKCHFAHGAGEIQRHGKVADAVIYDCGISWEQSRQAGGEQDAEQRQLQQQQQMPESSTGFALYPGSYGYQQIPYFRPEMYGYGQYTTTTPQNGGFYNDPGNHNDANSQAQQQQQQQHGGQQEASYEWSEEE